MKADPAPVYVVRFRPGRGRWKRVGAAASLAGALALVNAKGDWHLSFKAGAAQGREAAYREVIG